MYLNTLVLLKMIFLSVFVAFFLILVTFFAI